MDNNQYKINESSASIIKLCFFGLLGNTVLSIISSLFNLPFSLDCIGTITVAVLGGYFPGIFVGLFTNLLKGLSNSSSVYYAFLNIMFAVSAAFFSKNGRFKNIKSIILFYLSIVFISSVFGFLLNILLDDVAVIDAYHLLANKLETVGDISRLKARFVSELAIEICDKAISLACALLVLKLIPEKTKEDYRYSFWQQAPLPDEEVKSSNHSKYRKISLRSKILAMLIGAMLSIAVVATFISLILYRDSVINDHTVLAKGLSQLVAEQINPEKIDNYIESGKTTIEYKRIFKFIRSLINEMPEVEYIYVYKIEDDGCHVVFDPGSSDENASLNGEVLPWEKAFEKYKDDLLAGKEIEPIISNDTYGWFLTVYSPVYNKNGDCVCYACVDVSMNRLGDLQRNFFIKLLTIFIGFFILALVVGMTISKYNIILPLNTMAMRANDFAFNSEESRENSVVKFRQLNIRTGDEIENLYDAFLKTTEDSVKYVADLQEKTSTISNMQSGLIMVLANMVENRDQDTGDHVRKTATYVKIIATQLKKNGAYPNIITDSFIEDCYKSAPLHDVGKIQVPDAILNKPGKLTDEEFELIKTHTTAGENIILEAMKTVPDSDYLNEAKNLAGSHHEKWNGKGYPRGLKGEDIPLSARIMAVADVFDALVSKRCYKAPFPFEKAVSIIQEDSGTHFDPTVVKAFMDAIEEIKQVSEQFSENI